ncbi:unnamed protein product [Effrenium voratum]|uniref:DUF1826 domain-containing protein n=1 Tax=Effrenium voratum TaxID=2562239 RepID=A0AA36JS07_9DINO|nr:unnamed protein product [Effrenium voratum]CAJ1449346.1 unnamed protein product [Effrenium voratum]
MPRLGSRFSALVVGMALQMQNMQSAFPVRPSHGYRAVRPYQAPGPVLATGLFAGSSLGDWLRRDAAAFQGLHLPRRPHWPNYQEEIDRAADSFGPEGQVAMRIFPQQGRVADFQQVANEIGRGVSLPQDLMSVIRADICALGRTVASLCPWSKTFIVKLELMGEHSCPRWHRDEYCARAIVSYNLAGTNYATEDNVDFWELDHCGNNDHIIRDASKVRQVGVGDLLFIKGRKFPGARGLVHKSPPLQYANNVVLNRLVLKIDVPSL